MKTNRILWLITAMTAALAGCGGSVLELETWEEHDGDDGHGALTYEGAGLTQTLDPAGISPVVASEKFMRMGLTFEARDAKSIEVRASADGQTWTEWAAPTVVHSEEGFHTGHIDATPGSTLFQYRVRPGLEAPSFVSFEPIDAVGDAANLPERAELETNESDVVLTGEGPAPEGEFGSAEQGLASNPVVHSRAEWGARAPRCRSSTSPTRATIHHTVTPTNDTISPQARLRGIQAFHMNSRGWCDIGYNYLVSRDGRIWRARGRTTLGAHVANANSGNVGISYMGTYTSTAPTATQLCQGGRLLAALKRLHPAISLNRTDVKGHRQFGGTTCPGNALYDRINKIVSNAINGCG